MQCKVQFSIEVKIYVLMLSSYLDPGFDQSDHEEDEESDEKDELECVEDQPWQEEEPTFGRGGPQHQEVGQNQDHVHRHRDGQKISRFLQPIRHTRRRVRS